MLSVSASALLNTASLPQCHQTLFSPQETLWLVDADKSGGLLDGACLL